MRRRYASVGTEDSAPKAASGGKNGRCHSASLAENETEVERVGARLVQTMTDNVDDSFRGVEDVEGTRSACASGHV